MRKNYGRKKGQKKIEGKGGRRRKESETILKREEIDEENVCDITQTMDTNYLITQSKC